MTPKNAYAAVKSAISKGLLIRPGCCSKCRTFPGLAKDGRSKIQAHHHDYSKPLEVEWLCAKCHRSETPLPPVVGGPAIGERNGQAKMNEVSVRSARRLREKGLTFQAIADRFGVDKKTAMRAIKGERWKHVV